MFSLFLKITISIIFSPSITTFHIFFAGCFLFTRLLYVHVPQWSLSAFSYCTAFSFDVISYNNFEIITSNINFFLVPELCVCLIVYSWTLFGCPNHSSKWRWSKHKMHLKPKMLTPNVLFQTNLFNQWHIKGG